LPPA
jgi:hypothetical protein